MNKVVLIGRLVRDPELRYTPSNIPVCQLTVAVDRRFKSDNQQQTADFIPCVAWRQTAEFISKYFEKGRRIAVEGSIQTRSWEDDDGKKHYITEIAVSQAEFVENKSAQSERPAESSGSRLTQRPKPEPDAQIKFGEILPEDEGLTFDLDDDCPF